MLVRMFYVSEISPGCTDVEVQVILGQAQVRNRRLDVMAFWRRAMGISARFSKAVRVPLTRWSTGFAGTGATPVYVCCLSSPATGDSSKDGQWDSW